MRRPNPETFRLPIPLLEVVKTHCRKHNCGRGEYYCRLIREDLNVTGAAFHSSRRRSPPKQKATRF
jgi:hypothetical protein